VTFDASRTPSHEIVEPDGEVRSALDPDDFSCGFGVWSGTSFAAPVFAGELAGALAATYRDGDTAQDTATAVARLRRLLAGRPGRRQPPGAAVAEAVSP
jgi:subtilisin family serine protease